MKYRKFGTAELRISEIIFGGSYVFSSPSNSDNAVLVNHVPRFSAPLACGAAGCGLNWVLKTVDFIAPDSSVEVLLWSITATTWGPVIDHVRMEKI